MWKKGAVDGIPRWTRVLMLVTLFGLVWVAQPGESRAQFEVGSLHPPEYFGEGRIVSGAPAVRYNRVEGLFFGARITARPVPISGLSFPVCAGYGFHNKRWRYSLGVHQGLFRGEQLTLGAVFFDETASNDGWRLRQVENSLAALLLKEDFMDYFGRTGWQIFLDERLEGRHTARVVYASYRYQDMGADEGLAGALFGGKKQFRANPHIVEGHEQSVRLIIELDWRDSSLLPFEGTLVQAIYEKTWQDFTSDGLFVTVTHFRPTFAEQRFVVRAMVGARARSLAPQHLLALGGVGSLRGFRQNSQTGQNLVLLNAAYYFGGDILRVFSPGRRGGHDRVSLGLFCDAGSAWAVERVKKSLFSELDGYHVLADAGVSVLVGDGVGRVDFAKQVHGGDGSWRITLRLLSAL
ncbi:MAG: outer membrane protein assembly factor [candidate division KSB1 bacterium]|nr:outer membrane protein assembly factor [candidate division KSB1 bacterium]MDZ7392184.1 outer membrane protein assembly factor [candidate division KSB1 bacterium]